MADHTSDDIFLSVVIPAFNEAARIGPTIEKISAFLERKDYVSEIVVVDDGSTDGTVDVAGEAIEDRFPGKVISNTQNRGKGYTVREGVLASEGRFVLFTDADLSTPIEEYDKLLGWMDEGYDVAIGSRALPDSDVQVPQSFLREKMGKTFNWLVRHFVLPGIQDTQCGFKLFRKEAARDVFSRLQIHGFGFDVEALVLCEELGYRVREVPVIWRNSPPSRVRLFGSSLAMLGDLWRIRSGRARARR